MSSLSPLSTHLHGHGQSPEICTNEPRYDQATPGGRCSGTLVSPTLVLTAGHCTPNDGDCSDRMFLFRDELESSMDPRGDASTGVVFFPDENVRACNGVIAQQGALPGNPDSAEIDAEMVQGTPGTDWGVMELSAPAPAGALPLPVERYHLSQAGDPALCLSHPARLPVKGQQESIALEDETSIATSCYSLGGSSGGRVVNLKTGYLVGIHHWVSGFPTQPGNNDPVGCMNPCFTCAQVTTSDRTFAPALFVPPVGLQFSPATAVLDYYGPPSGNPADYAEQSMVISAPGGSLDIDWSIALAPWFALPLIQSSGPSSGTLTAGNQETLTLAVTSNRIGYPGIVDYPSDFSDTTYQTLTPLLHRLHVGVDGFTAAPEADYVGEGPGALPGDRTQYGIYNRWIVAQDITVTADEPWIVVYEEYPPFGPTIPPLFTNFYTIEPDASGLSTGIHTGNVTWESLDSGTPSFTISRQVRFDVGRHISGGTYNPTFHFTIDGSNPVENIPVVWSGPTTPITDADVAVSLSASWIGGGGLGFVEVSLVSPQGTVVGLVRSLGVSSAVSTIFDDDTNPPEIDPLTDLTSENPGGTWFLRVEQVTPETDLAMSLSRFEVRLHVD